MTCKTRCKNCEHQACLQATQLFQALLVSRAAHMRCSLMGASSCYGATQHMGELSWLCQPVPVNPPMHTLQAEPEAGDAWQLLALEMAGGRPKVLSCHAVAHKREREREACTDLARDGGLKSIKVPFLFSTTDLPSGALGAGAPFIVDITAKPVSR